VRKRGDHPQRDTDGVSDRHTPSHSTEGAAVSVWEVWEKFFATEAKEEAIQLGVCPRGDAPACRGTVQLSSFGEAISGEFRGESESEFAATDGGRSRKAVQESRGAFQRA
jgi:hypothetical protein